MKKRLVSFKVIVLMLLLLTQTTFAASWNFVHIGETWECHDGDLSLTLTLLGQDNNSIDVSISAALPDHRYDIHNERMKLFFNEENNLVGEYRSRRGWYHPVFQANDESQQIIGVLDLQDLGGKSVRLYGPVEMRLLR